VKEGLIERIRAYGYWRINFRPLSLPEKQLLLGKCREIVVKSSVSIRGWDFPSISHRNDEHGGFSNEDNYVEDWTELQGFNEFWRLYSSSQFLAYVALREDTMPEAHGNPKMRILITTSAVYEISEFLEFCHRLFKNGLYKDGLRLTLSLENTRGRILAAGWQRMPFPDRKQTNAERIELTELIYPERLAEEHRNISVDLCLRLFDRFGWNPDPTQIRAEQERFYRKDWR